MALMATAWLQRSEDRELALDPAGPVALATDAGPVEIRNGPSRALRYRASWLLVGPEERIDQDPLEPTVVLRCDTAFPCRAAAELELPAGVGASVTSAHDVTVSRYDGPLGIRTTGRGAVSVGPVTGRLRAETEEGDVSGYGLRSPEVVVETRRGVVDLGFGARPRRVEVEAGIEPVTIELPDGDYAVSVRGGSSVVIDLGRSPTADSEIVVRARGPVRIRPAT